jgi:predicted nucleic acid-binding protein
MDGTLVSAALNGKADIFVTGDQEVLGQPRIGHMDIVSPRMIWERSEAQARKALD